MINETTQGILQPTTENMHRSSFLVVQSSKLLNISYPYILSCASLDNTIYEKRPMIMQVLGWSAPRAAPKNWQQYLCCRGSTRTVIQDVQLSR
jgi:hypothetical protein